jgi:NhaC family Na+:H+ antiporter
MVILGAAIVIGFIIKNGTLNCAFGGYIISRYFCNLFQPHIINQIAGVEQMTFESGYKGVMDAITVKWQYQLKTKHLLIYSHLAECKKC